MKKNSTSFIVTLPREVRAEIARRLVMAGVHANELDRAMSSRLCDLADTISIEGLLGGAS